VELSSRSPARFVASVPQHGAPMDMGSSDGQTLRHFAELRPDIAFHSSDLAGSPADYPHGTEFQRADFETDPLPWPDARFDAITCMHGLMTMNFFDDPTHIQPVPVESLERMAR
jgi:hypothetical protein